MIKELELTYLISLICVCTSRRILHRPYNGLFSELSSLFFHSSDTHFHCCGRCSNCGSSNNWDNYFGCLNWRDRLDFDGGGSWGYYYRSLHYRGWSSLLCCGLFHCVKRFLCIISCYFSGLISNLFSLQVSGLFVGGSFSILLRLNRVLCRFLGGLNFSSLRLELFFGGFLLILFSLSILQCLLLSRGLLVFSLLSLISFLLGLFSCSFSFSISLFFFGLLFCFCLL